MTLPLVILAVFAVLLGFVGTPAWPWFQSFIEGRTAVVSFGQLVNGGTGLVLLLSTAIVALGIGLGWCLYGNIAAGPRPALDPLAAHVPGLFDVLAHKFYVDELYEASVIRANLWWAWACDWLDRFVWNGAVVLVSS